MSRDAFLAGTKQVCRKQPLMKRDMRAFVDGADCGSKWFLAGSALVQPGASAATFEFGCFVEDATMWANRAVWPANLLEMRSCGVLVVEDRICEVYSHRASLSCYLYSDYWAVCQVHNCRYLSQQPTEVMLIRELRLPSAVRHFRVPKQRLRSQPMGATWPNITAAEAPRFADRLEAWGAALSLGAFKLLPRDCASALGGALARRIGPSLGVSRHARRNISRAFPELSGTEIGRIVTGMWDNLGRVVAEYPHLRKICVFEPGGPVETHGFEHVDRAVAAGRRMIFFSGHIANWETIDVT